MVGLENPLHIVMLLLVVLLIFGAKRLPEMGRSLGSGLRGFKESLSGEDPTPANHDHIAERPRALTEAVSVPDSANESATPAPEPTQARRAA